MASHESQKTAHLEQQVVAAARQWFYEKMSDDQRFLRESEIGLGRAVIALDDHDKAMKLAAQEQAIREGRGA